MPYEALVKKLASCLKGIVFRMNVRCAALNHDDLYQEALIHLWQAYRAGELADKTDSYILQGCYFHLKNYMRTHREKALTVPLDAPMDDGEEGFCRNAPCSLETKESLREEVHCAMLIEQIRNNGLTIREKEVFLLCLEGLTMREIGSRLGISHVRVVKVAKGMREKCRAHLRD